jgi:hypothetical protein
MSCLLGESGSDAQADRGFRSPVMLGWQLAWRDSPRGSVVGGCRSSPIGGTILFRPVQLGGEVEAINLAHRCFGDINQLVISNGLYSGPQENLTLSTPPSHL